MLRIPVKTLPAQVLVLALSLALGACSAFQRRESSDQPAEKTPDEQYLNVNLDQWIAAGSELARLNGAGRLSECHKLQHNYLGNRQLAILMRVFAAQLLTEDCGDLARTTRVLSAFRPQIPDARLRNVLLHQLALAERISARSAERAILQRRLDNTRYNLKKALSNSRQAISSSKQALSKQREALSEREQALSQTREIYRQMVTRDAEARRLKEKLEALKTIEQDLNETER